MKLAELIERKLTIKKKETTKIMMKANYLDPSGGIM
jgi:hypothetical protein